MNFNIKNNNILCYEEKLININRVSKTVKGGRIFSFTAITIIGNNKGKIGFGYGKSKEVPIAIQKSINKAYKNIFFININNNKTIYHETYGKYLCSKIFLKPANKGTGVISSNYIKPIFKLSGIENIITKIYGSKNISNTIKATINALININKIKYISEKRNKKIYFF